MKKGTRYRPVVTIMKEKDGVPTAILVSGRRYQLNNGETFKEGVKKSGLRVIG